MDKPRRRAQHLQLVHSEPAAPASQRGPRVGIFANRTAVALGCAALALLIWTRASDMPEHEPTGDAPAPTEVAQNFPAGESAATRHISAVLAFDVLLVTATNEARDATVFLEPDASLRPGSQLAFRLYNRSSQAAWFLLFSVDAQQHIQWLYPPAHAEGVNRSLPLAAVPRVELPEPVRLPTDTSGMCIVGVFTDAPVTTMEVEQIWGRGGVAALQGTLRAQVQTLTLGAEKP